jgi:hypothetical protein
MNVKRADAKSVPAFTERDRKELSRLVGKYGRAKVLAEAARVPLPRPRHRPKDDPEDALNLYDVIYCLWKWEEEYRVDGSKTPAEHALRDVYEIAIDNELQQMAGHYERWRQTIKKKLRADKKQKRPNIRRAIESYLERARATTPLMSGKKSAAD